MHLTTEQLNNLIDCDLEIKDFLIEVRKCFTEEVHHLIVGCVKTWTIDEWCRSTLEACIYEYFSWYCFKRWDLINYIRYNYDPIARGDFEIYDINNQIVEEPYTTYDLLFHKYI